MMMKYAILKMLAIMLSIAVFAPARAGHIEVNDAFYDRAKVLSVTPVYKIVKVATPRRKCHRKHSKRHSARYNDDAYRPLTTMIAGGALGDSIAHELSYRYKTGHGGHQSHGGARRCESYHEYQKHKRLDGYRVKYRYNGRIFHTRTDTDPGRKMRVRVSVVPET
jgi:uncharacterized protein YcfJ